MIYRCRIKKSIQQRFAPSTGPVESDYVTSLLNNVSEQMWEHFKCPITQDIMKEPVLSADGYSYERTAIEKWFEVSNNSPLTGLPLSDKTLRPNHNLRSQINTFCSSLVGNKK